MAVPFSNTKLRVPRGFQNLLEGLAREVLRSQPSDVYAFGASYFDALLQKREETGMDPVDIGAKLEDRFYNNKAFTDPEVDPSNPQHQDAARVIQTKYRQHAAKQEVDALREEKAATTIQAGFRGHQDRVKVAKIRDSNDDGGASVSTNDVDFEQMKAGFKARKEAQAEKTQSQVATAPPPEEAVDIDLNDPEVKDAAILIQAGFRSMMARKKDTKAKRPEKPLGPTAAEAAPMAMVDDLKGSTEMDEKMNGDSMAEPADAGAEADQEQPATDDTVDESMADGQLESEGEE